MTTSILRTMHTRLKIHLNPLAWRRGLPTLDHPTDRDPAYNPVGRVPSRAGSEDPTYNPVGRVPSRGAGSGDPAYNSAGRVASRGGICGAMHNIVISCGERNSWKVNIRFEATRRRSLRPRFLI